MKKIFLISGLVAVTANAATTVPVQLISPTGSSVGQAVVSTGSGSAPTWGTVTAGTLVPQAANTAVANTTNATASPTAVALPSCSATTNALQYATGLGFLCNTAINAASVGGNTFSAPGPIGGAIPNTGLFTGLTATTLDVTNSLPTGVSMHVSSTSNTGTGAAILLTGDGATTPSKYLQAQSGVFKILNNAASPILTLSDSGTLTPTYPAGVSGNTSGSNVSAGSIGEYIFSEVSSGSAVSVSTGTATNITSIPLTAGDWDLDGDICTQPAGGTTTQLVYGSTNSISGVLGAVPGLFINGGTGITGIGACTAIPRRRVLLSGSQTWYLVAQVNFASSTMQVFGGIYARRR